MQINATITSVTGKMIVIAYRIEEKGFPQVVERNVPYAFKNWEAQDWIDTVEIRCAYKGQKWGLGKQDTDEGN